MRNFGCFGLSVRDAACQQFDDTVADVYLIVQVSPLQLVQLPVKFTFDVLIADFLQKAGIDERAVETADDIEMNECSIFG